MRHMLNWTGIIQVYTHLLPFLLTDNWQLTLRLTGERRSYSAAGKPSCSSLSSVLSDSLGLIQNHGVGTVISSLSISNPQQVEEQRIIKMSGGKMLLPYWNSSQSMHVKAPHGRPHGKWLPVGNVSQMGFCVGEWMSMFTRSSGISREESFCYEYNLWPVE